MSYGAGAVRGGMWGMRLGALLGPLGAAVGTVVGAAAGVAVTAGAAYLANEAISNQMSKADGEAENTLGSEADVAEGDMTDACAGCEPPDDPCSGLRRQLQEHENKLRDYRSDPAANDNLGILGHSPERDAAIIAGRIRNLEGQIENFRRQLAECEARNANS